MRILNVAEKPSIAKTISQILSARGGGYSSRAGRSQYNRLFDFRCDVRLDPASPPQPCDMTMTSVRGHLKEIDFGPAHRGWKSCPPSQLFEAPIVSRVSRDCEPIAHTLKQEGRRADALIIWTDCDREGEAIGMEIVEVVREVAPHVLVKRARFSVADEPNIFRAIDGLTNINVREAEAVAARQEIDLRLGAAFTRLQTLQVAQRFPSLAEKLLSFGSCQFPTLGFIVRQFEACRSFVPEAFWYIKMDMEIAAPEPGPGSKRKSALLLGSASAFLTAMLALCYMKNAPRIPWRRLLTSRANREASGGRFPWTRLSSRRGLRSGDDCLQSKLWLLQRSFISRVS